MSKSVAAFFIVVVLAFAWRGVGITFDSLWLDEGYQTIVDAYGQPLPDFTRVPERPYIYKPSNPVDSAAMLQNFRNVDPLTPPLYQLLLNRWITAFGGSDFSLRMMSVLISTACVGVVFWFTYALFGLRVATLVGLVQGFSPFDIYYGQEVRMYGLLTLAAAVSVGTLILLLLHYIRGRWRVIAWIAYVVATWAMINSHYCGLFVALLEGLLGLSVAIAARNWRLLGLLVLSWVMVGVLWLPWLRMFLQAAAIRTGSFYVAREPSLWWPFYALLLKIPGNWVSFLSGKQVVAPAVLIYVTSAICLLTSFEMIFANLIGRKLKAMRSAAPPVVKLDRRTLIACVFIILWAMIPAVALWAIDVLENHRVIEIARYSIATAPAIYVLAGLGFASFRLRDRLSVAFVAVYFLSATINNIAHATVIHQREPWREMAHKLEAEVPDSNEVVLVAQHYNIICLDRYLKIPYRQVGVASTMAPDKVAALVAGLPRFTLITAQEGESFTSLVPPQYKLLKKVDLSHGLHLRIYSL